MGRIGLFERKRDSCQSFIACYSKIDEAGWSANAPHGGPTHPKIVARARSLVPTVDCVDYKCESSGWLRKEVEAVIVARYA